LAANNPFFGGAGAADPFGAPPTGPFASSPFGLPPSAANANPTEEKAKKTKKKAAVEDLTKSVEDLKITEEERGGAAAGSTVEKMKKKKKKKKKKDDGEKRGKGEKKKISPKKSQPSVGREEEEEELEKFMDLMARGMIDVDGNEVETEDEDEDKDEDEDEDKVADGEEEDGEEEDGTSDEISKQEPQSKQVLKSAACPSVLEQMADSLFKLFKKNSATDTIGGGQLQPVMLKCDPPVENAMLGKIWSAASDGAKDLNKAQIVKMLAFIGQVQSGATPNLDEYDHAPAPTISGLAIPTNATSAASFPETTPSGGDDEPSKIEQMADNLFGLFKKNSATDTLSGGQLQPVMSKCDPAVENSMLGKIWSSASGGAKELNKHQVVKMLAFIGQVQSGATPNASNVASAPAPNITGLPIP
jgi:hypothetical protein